jgi:asparagine synthase (glutamine-hydrolysing)
MCGIAGIVPTDGAAVDRCLLQEKAVNKAHRGFSDKGIWMGDVLSLGHRQLWILESASAGHQSIRCSDGHPVWVYNGEIYNYMERRRELRTLEDVVRSGADTALM